MMRAAQVLRRTGITRRATLLCDFNICTSTPSDDFYNFVDCKDADISNVARDLRAGIIKMENRVIIALGNSGTLNNFTNLCTPVNKLITSIIERKGCPKVRVFVMGILPRLRLQPDEEQILKKQNKALGKSVSALIRRRQYPVQFVPAYKWLLKRVIWEDQREELVPDNIYYVQEEGVLSPDGLNHLYLLLAKEVGIFDTQYSNQMAVVHMYNSKRKVLKDLCVNVDREEQRTVKDTTQKDDELPKKKKIKTRGPKGHHVRCKVTQEEHEVGQKRRITEQEGPRDDSDSDPSDPPILVEIPGLE